MDIIDGVISLSIFVIVLAIVAMIISKIAPNITGSDELSNATIASIFQTGWSALAIASVASVVIGAVLILGVVMNLRGSSQQ
ncbi:hypothetical protein SDC9_96739 [bioreactor metagenome]|uniref:Uncharacterized protein n=1 Tax=bioreactor metagenome TaxID=1076179 RepID=A0A645A9W5_9ZZZZ